MRAENDSRLKTMLANPVLATGATVVAGLLFLLLCTLLPLVGPAGTAVPYSGKNHSAFLPVALLTLAVSALATFLKLMQRRQNRGPLPMFAICLTLVTAATILALWTGVLAL